MNDYEARTLRRLLRHVPGVTIEKPTPTSYHHVVTINGVSARAMVGDGFLTFGVRRVRWLDGKWDTGLAVVCVPKIQRDRPLFRLWLTALHASAAYVQLEATERAANFARERRAEFFRQHEALSFPDRFEDA